MRHTTTDHEGNTMISLTKAAADQIRAAAANSDAEGMALRLAAKVNAAGMLEFGMGFDQERENDTIHESWGITLLISKHSAPYLEDVTLDFTEVAPGQMSFVFFKPGSEAPSDTGCGSGCGSGGGCGSGSCG
ncbi:MAG: iron-sulfur cluster assembly accessory protein [Thiobacillaceae bacterium]|nr:iron-sulfur cluster assembly accessory protein [Thiobacillaceae bacterium]